MPSDDASTVVIKVVVRRHQTRLLTRSIASSSFINPLFSLHRSRHQPSSSASSDDSNPLYRRQQSIQMESEDSITAFRDRLCCPLQAGSRLRVGPLAGVCSPPSCVDDCPGLDDVLRLLALRIHLRCLPMLPLAARPAMAAAGRESWVIRVMGAIMKPRGRGHRVCDGRR
jgi:hypothetical protein